VNPFDGQQYLYPHIMNGIVKATDDPNQDGRCRIWVPAIDGERYAVDALPWAEYASPFGGVTTDFKAGRDLKQTSGPRAYGFWAIPKIGAEVLVFCLNGDPSARYYFASHIGMHRNRGLPTGRNDDITKGRLSDTGNPIQPATNNLKQQFGDLSAPQAKTRGAFERQAAQNKTTKDGKEGYYPNAVDGSILDPQEYCFVTPGGNAFIMQDDPENCRMRFVTTEGNQIIFDDANERIYVSTARGGTWLELDEDGPVHVFANESVSIGAGKDINLAAKRDVRIAAGRDIDMSANGSVRVQAKGALHVKSSGGSVYVSACSNLSLRSDAVTSVDGQTLLNLCGPTIINKVNSGSRTPYDHADSCADDAQTPTITPSHEPWNRPASAIKRNKNWRP